MVETRIYRAGWLIVLVAVVIFGFSLRDRPPGLPTAVSPGTDFTSVAGEATALADRFGVVAPGTLADSDMAAAVAAQLRSAGGFSVTDRSVTAATAAGTQAVATVEAERPGLGQGTVVVIANRDGVVPGPAGFGRPGPAAVAATAPSAMLVALARALSGSTLNRSVLLVSTSGAVGAAGATRLAERLGGANVDAALVLGDLSAARIRGPVLAPWTGGERLAPPLLGSTVTTYLRPVVGAMATDPSFGSEVVQLALPFVTGSQAPFRAVGIPAVGISLTGDRLGRAGERVDLRRLSSLGAALDEIVNALDAGPAVPAASAYLTVSSKLIPLWAIRILVLGLIAPVALTLVDAVARVRRRGHSVLSWAVWVLSGMLPFLIGLAVLEFARVTHLLTAPPGAVGVGAPVTAAGAAVTGVALLAAILAFPLLRPAGVQLASGIGWRRTPTTPVIEGAAVGLSIVLCGLSLLVWAVNPFAAFLLVPALHLSLWLGAPATVRSPLRAAAIVAGGLLVPALALLYYLVDLGLTPWRLAWDLTLAVVGGAIAPGTAAALCVALGILASAVVLLLRAVRAADPAPEPSVSVRGPVSYAGPGSLGGTRSALRR